MDVKSVCTTYYWTLKLSTAQLKAISYKSSDNIQASPNSEFLRRSWLVQYLIKVCNQTFQFLNYLGLIRTRLFTVLFITQCHYEISDTRVRNTNKEILLVIGSSKQRLRGCYSSHTKNLLIGRFNALKFSALWHGFMITKQETSQYEQDY